MVETQPNQDFPPGSNAQVLRLSCHKTIYEISSSGIRLDIAHSKNPVNTDWKEPACDAA